MGNRAPRKENPLTVACDPSSLDVPQRRRRRELQERLRADIREVRELEDGYALRHSSGASVLLDLAEFVALERLCCPFFDFEISIGRAGGPVWFRITGGEEAKRVLRAEMGARTERATNSPHNRESEGPGRHAPAQTDQLKPAT